MGLGPSSVTRSIKLFIVLANFSASPADIQASSSRWGSNLFQEAAQQSYSSSCSVVTADIMTISRVTSGHHYAVGAESECLHNPLGVNTDGTHSSYDTKVWFNLVSAYARQIAAGVGTPVTAKNNDFWFECICHFNSQFTNQSEPLLSLPAFARS